ncbi:hypothetical protein HF086_007064 [Spodoptera exigua]|uniref:Immunoglobulin I-set domain-containing protein n=1 Tax=Spodoptera exigua TaxID=7107 RepID=A0A922M5R9_SPOEX|nr:hypothetical protein HF086_007064 [Spodoptera exigua]
MSITSQGYKYTAILRVRNMSREDIGSYYCYAENSMGSTRDDVTVYSKYQLYSVVSYSDNRLLRIFFVYDNN